MFARMCIPIGALLSLAVACDDGGSDDGGSTGGSSTGTSSSPTTQTPTTASTSTEATTHTTHTTGTTDSGGTSSTGAGESTTAGASATGSTDTSGSDGSTGTGSTGTTGGEVLPGAEAIYVVDAGNNRVIRVDDLTGSNWTEYSDGLTDPVDVAVDGQGRIYITDRGTSEEPVIAPSIVRLDAIDDATPEVFTGGSYAFGGPGEPEAMLELEQPTQLEVGPDGSIYFTDVFRIVQIDAIPPTYWRTRGAYGSGGVNGNNPDQFFAMSDVYVDDTGVYVADATRNLIACMGAFDSTDWMVAGFEQPGADLNGPWSLVRHPGASGGETCPDATFTIVDRYNERVLQADVSFGLFPEDNAPGSQAGAMSNVQTYDVGAVEDLADLAMAPNGEIYVTEQNLVSILGMEDISGAGFTSFGDAGMGVGEFMFPWGIAVTPRPWDDGL